ncbi:MAG: hypothetical protein LW823_08780 [Rickettsiales bacterium]|nr:hypothetical protein [Rickettsiales bacterium]
MNGNYDNSAVSQNRIGIDSPATALKGDGKDAGGGGFFNSKGGLLVLGPLNNFIIEQFGTRNVLYIGGTTNIGGNTFGIYGAAESYAMDSKMDDAKPFSGKFRSISGLPMESVTLISYYPVSGTGEMACIDDVSQSPEIVYNLNQDMQSPEAYTSYCSPVILMNF